MNFSDEKLFQLCREYGRNALLWRQKFIGLLPEVNRRKLYVKKGFESIFVFAKKLAGLSEEQVRRTLNLEKKFEATPILKSLLENGEVSINKLARVASIATKENEEILAEQVKLLPNRAIETLVRDEKLIHTENENGFQEPLFEDKSVHVQTLNFEIDDDLKEELNELHWKGINVNELLRTMLAGRKAEIAQEKEKISATIQPAKSRYISVQIKNILKKEYGDKCSIKGCHKPAKIVHHTQRYGLVRSHDPNFLAQLCEEHHKIAHSFDVKFHEIRLKNLKSS